MESEFFLENVKCNGCRKTIILEAKKQKEIEQISVDIETGKVTLEYRGGHEILSRVKSRLYRKGYPVKGQNNHILSKGKSFVSCAMGRMTSDAVIEVKQIQF